MRRRFAVGPALLVLLGCGDGAGPLGSTGEEMPALAVAATPTIMQGEAGERAPWYPGVRVVSSGGRPVPGVTVHWSTEHGEVAAATSVTAGDGIAANGWLLPGRLGTATLTARVEGLSPVTFTTEVGPGPPVRFEKMGGDEQRVGPDRPLHPLLVRRVDRFGHPTAVQVPSFGWSGAMYGDIRVVEVPPGSGIWGITFRSAPWPGTYQVRARATGIEGVVFTYHVEP